MKKDNVKETIAMLLCKACGMVPTSEYKSTKYQTPAQALSVWRDHVLGFDRACLEGEDAEDVFVTFDDGSMLFCSDILSSEAELMVVI